MTDRQRAEQAAWDEMAARQAADLAALEAVSATWGSIHDMLLRDVEPIAGTRLLDCGCGVGVMSRAAAGRGARVVGFDVSYGSVHVARQAGETGPAGEAVSYMQSAFEHLPFPDGAFSSAVGMFVLHHVELAPAARELARVMAPGGKAAFIETWQRNPMIKAARKLRGRFGVAMYGTPDEEPLGPADLDTLRTAGFDISLEYPGLVLLRLIDNNVLKGRSARLSRLLVRGDEMLGRVPAVKPWGFYAVIRLTRR